MCSNKWNLEQAIESEPQLTEDKTEYVETRRKARDQAFRELVREAYDNTCAVCGKNRESPNGNPEVEAAHIYPKSKGGSDDVRNGIALCKLHHWAFDTGWISINNDYEILVAELPERDGYYDFKQLEEKILGLPDTDKLHPHVMYLDKHRESYGYK